jgi:hypothetical protein
VEERRWVGSGRPGSTRFFRRGQPGGSSSLLSPRRSVRAPTVRRPVRACGARALRRCACAAAVLAAQARKRASYGALRLCFPRARSAAPRAVLGARAVSRLRRACWRLGSTRWLSEYSAGWLQEEVPATTDGRMTDAAPTRVLAALWRSACSSSPSCSASPPRQARACLVEPLRRAQSCFPWLSWPLFLAAAAAACPLRTRLLACRPRAGATHLGCALLPARQARAACGRVRVLLRSMRSTHLRHSRMLTWLRARPARLQGRSRVARAAAVHALIRVRPSCCFAAWVLGC